MKILVYKPHPLMVDAIKDWEDSNDIKVDTINELINRDNINRLKDYDGVVLTAANKLDDKMYDILKDLNIKQIALTSVGFEQMDLDLAKKSGIIITNNPYYSPESIAEFTIMMILKLLRKDTSLKEKLSHNDYRHSSVLLGETLHGKTVGIYGLGTIGFLVANMLRGFGVKIISYTRNPKPYAKNTLEFVKSFEELLKRSDIISIHTALTEDNYHIFDKDAFEIMKDNAYIINTARGALIDTKALLDALDNDKLRGAALDVYEYESPIIGRNNPKYDDPLFDKLIQNPKVDFYNHMAYFTDIAIENQIKIALDSVVDVIKTGDSRYRVN